MGGSASLRYLLVHDGYAEQQPEDWPARSDQSSARIVNATCARMNASYSR